MRYNNGDIVVLTGKIYGKSVEGKVVKILSFGTTPRSYDNLVLMDSVKTYIPRECIIGLKENLVKYHSHEKINKYKLIEYEKGKFGRSVTDSFKEHFYSSSYTVYLEKVPYEYLSGVKFSKYDQNDIFENFINDFKIGDKVICVMSHFYLKDGGIYEIISIDHENNYVGVKSIDGSYADKDTCWLMSRFRKIVDEEKLKKKLGEIKELRDKSKDFDQYEEENWNDLIDENFDIKNILNFKSWKNKKNIL